MDKQKKQDQFQLFFHDGYLLGQQAANSITDHKKFNQILHQFYQTIDELLDSLLNYAQQNGVKVDCKKGCSCCCYQPVFANQYEINYLRDYIQTHFSKENITKIKKKAIKKDQAVSQLSPQEVLYHKEPCPLLNREGACSAYGGRPVACRIYLSLNLESCQYFYKYPKDPQHYPQLMDFPLKAGRMLNQGFSAALKESGIDTGEMRLETLFREAVHS